MEAYPQLKCQVKGHENNLLTYICTDENCKKSERILCTKCAINHGNSANYLLVEEFVKQEPITNWPNDQYGQRIKSLIAQSDEEKGNEIIDDLFDYFLCEFKKKLEDVKKSIKFRFAQHLSKLSNFAVSLSMAYEEGYDLSFLQEQMYDYMKDNISLDKLNDYIQEFF